MPRTSNRTHIQYKIYGRNMCRVQARPKEVLIENNLEVPIEDIGAEVQPSGLLDTKGHGPEVSHKPGALNRSTQTVQVVQSKSWLRSSSPPEPYHRPVMASSSFSARVQGGRRGQLLKAEATGHQARQNTEGTQRALKKRKNRKLQLR